MKQTKRLPSSILPVVEQQRLNLPLKKIVTSKVMIQSLKHVEKFSLHKSSGAETLPTLGLREGNDLGKPTLTPKPFFFFFFFGGDQNKRHYTSVALINKTWQSSNSRGQRGA